MVPEYYSILPKIKLCGNHLGNILPGAHNCGFISLLPVCLLMLLRFPSVIIISGFLREQRHVDSHTEGLCATE